MSDERKAARLELIAFIQRLPLDADICMQVRRIGRVDYDKLGGESYYLRSSHVWTKDIELGPGVDVELYTRTTPPSLSVVKDNGSDSC